jgi:hypothetical protein
MSIKIPAYLHTTQVYIKPLLKAFPGEINISRKGYECVCVCVCVQKKNRKEHYFTFQTS